MSYEDYVILHFVFGLGCLFGGGCVIFGGVTLMRRFFPTSTTPIKQFVYLASSVVLFFSGVCAFGVSCKAAEHWLVTKRHEAYDRQHGTKTWWIRDLNDLPRFGTFGVDGPNAVFKGYGRILAVPNDHAESEPLQ